MTQDGGFRFRIPGRQPSKPQDPEALFRSLSGRSAKVEYLWSHQADILREWFSNHRGTRDLALELPTGTGKTLIGLLIGEFRRQTLGDRVAYLCPTRQLAHQVGNLAEEYTIPVRVLVGPQADYDPADYTAYTSAAAIAVTTYTAVFNTRPRINDANTLILDDAHASEGFIASLWSVDIDRFEHRETYLALVELFRDALPSWLVSNLLNDHEPSARGTSDKVPSPTFMQRAEALGNFFDEALTGNLRFPWSMLRANLSACHMFMSWPVISIRPTIPPTMTHEPFASARQRVYMSATLGEGGELERITGVKDITRLPAPEGWERQGTGRRFVLFPDLSLPRRTADRMISEVVAQRDRTLVLTPDRLTAAKVIDLLNESSTDLDILTANDIEVSLDPFVESQHAALVLQGRYDGLDLPGETCRLEVIYGLPGATSAQERFLLTRLGAHSLLRDRIRTRLTQGLGRCTRSAVDHSVVLIAGERTLDFCIKSENKSGFHPEIQAEFQYGLEASNVQFPEELREVAANFLVKAPGWEEVDRWIQERRDSVTRVPDASAATLMAISSDEVDYAYLMWQEDYGAALERARKCADALGGPDLAPYRAWWYYLAGSAAWIAGSQSGDVQMANVAREMFERAAGAAPAVTWFGQLARTPLLKGRLPEPEDPLAAIAVENIETRLSEIGVVGGRFDKEVSEFFALVDDDDPIPFERGLESLGRWLGFEASRPGRQGDPDSIWRLGDQVIVAFEAKSQQSTEGPVSLDNAREAQGHLNWVKSNLKPPEDTEVFGVVVSPRTSIGSEAIPHCESLYLLHPSAVRGTARDIVSLVRAISGGNALKVSRTPFCF